MIKLYSPFFSMDFALLTFFFYKELEDRIPAMLVLLSFIGKVSISVFPMLTYHHSLPDLPSICLLMPMILPVCPSSYAIATFQYCLLIIFWANKRWHMFPCTVYYICLSFF